MNAPSIDLPSLGLKPGEISRLRRVARAVDANPAAVLAGLARIALGCPFPTDSLSFRLIDACNHVGSIRKPSQP